MRADNSIEMSSDLKSATATSATSPAAATGGLLQRLMLDHPRDIGETYGEHAGHALTIGTRMIGAGLACLVHALVPGLFVRTATSTVDNVLALMAKRSEEAADSGISIEGEAAL